MEALFNEVFEGKNEPVPIALLAEWVNQKEKNMFKIYEKPMFSTVIQALLNLIRKKSTFNEMSSNYNFPSSKDSKKIIFVNDKTFLDFIRGQSSTKTVKKSPNQSKFKDSSDDEEEASNLSSLKNSRKNKIDDNSLKIGYE